MGSPSNVNARYTINVTDLIDQNRLSSLQIRITILCGLVLFFDGYDIASLSSTVPLLADAIKVKVSLMGAVFVFTSIGILAGNLVFGSLADRFGRKWMTVLSTCLCGIFVLMTPHVGSLQGLMVVRLLTGLGIGGAMPNAMAMVSEYSPKRSRSFLMTLAFTGVPIGGSSAHFLAAFFMKTFGWHWVFYFGAIVPLVLCLILIAALPEAIRFMVNRKQESERITLLLTTMYGKFTPADVPEGAAVDFILSEDPHKRRVPLADVMKEGRAGLTILAWIANFMTLVVGLFITSWFPTVLRLNGIPLTTGVQIAGLFNLAAVFGTPIVGRLMDRWTPSRALTFSYIASIIFVASFGFAGKSLVLLGIVTFLAGFFVYGSQAGLMAFAATLYPISLRATGLGWVFGVGRAGPIVGQGIGAFMIARHWPLANMFMAAAVPALIATVCLLAMKQILQKREAQAAVAPEPAGGRQ